MSLLQRQNTPRPTALQNWWWDICDWFHEWGWGLAILLAYLLLYVMIPSHAEDVVCYKGGEELVKPTYSITNLLISVHWLAADHDDPDNDAWTVCEIKEGENIGWCDIYVVLPTHVLGDANMDALGHEVLHGLSGDFHK